MRPHRHRLRRTILAGVGIAVAVLISGSPQAPGVPGAAPGPTAVTTPVATPLPGPYTYYVSPGGSDANTGLTAAAPFQHIQQCASVARAGDTCLLRAGTYHETVIPSSSGTAGLPITFMPYPGESVTLDGADVVTSSWTVQSGSIYQTSVTLPASGYTTSCTDNTTLCANQLFVDGQMVNEARWPNTGTDLLHPALALTGTSAHPGTHASTTDATSVLVDGATTGALPASAASNGWAGATVVIWAGAGWNAQSGTVLTSTTAISPGMGVTGITSGCLRGVGSLCPGNQNYYFVTGLPALLDSAGEWAYVPGTQTLSLWMPSSDSPASHVVEAKARNYAFDLAGRSYITVSGLALHAATIRTDSLSGHDLLAGLVATYPSHFVTMQEPPFGASSPYAAVTGMTTTGLVITGTANVVSNTVVMSSAGNGIALLGDHNLVTNTLIAGVDYAGSYAAGIALQGHDNTVSNSTIRLTGRDGISANWRSLAGYQTQAPGNTCAAISGGCPLMANNRVSQTDIYNYLALDQDGGGIYICCSVDVSGSRFDHLFVHDDLEHNGFFTAPGSAGNSWGVYIDNYSFGALVDHTVSWGNVAPGGGGGAILFNIGVDKVNSAVNNTTPEGIVAGSSAHQVGTLVQNNIASGYGGFAGATFVTNVTGTVPFVSTGTHDYRPTSGASTAIDRGTVFPGVTDGFSGSSPDIGAFEFGGVQWKPGCTLVGCADPLTSGAAGTS